MGHLSDVSKDCVQRFDQVHFGAAWVEDPDWTYAAQVQAGSSTHATPKRSCIFGCMQYHHSVYNTEAKKCCIPGIQFVHLLLNQLFLCLIELLKLLSHLTNELQLAVGFH